MFRGAPNSWFERMAVADCRRTVVDSIIDSQPDIVVIDLVTDARHGIIARGDFVVTEDLMHAKRAVLDRAGVTATEQRVPPVSPERFAMFEQAVATLAPRLRAALPNARFVLHRSRGAQRLSDPERPTKFRVCAPTPSFDSRVARFERALVDALPGIVLLDPDPDHLVADLDHRWGPFFLHYIPEYYDFVLERLESIAAGA